ncbi:AbrB/MazE/SpoVT family DNA-binding domain-containing protein [Castellaniella hirudinis]|uniref:AbrB/MazE/SpoVT family DNA-binding domain-containing protein n=1 Tax=Castellaniella hirudinis TaxID=1144617 RepID=UPI0039C173FA
MSEAILSTKGQVTIPANIRRLLGVSAQDRITFTPMPDGTVVLRAKARSLKALQGMLVPQDGIKVSIGDMSLGES